MKTSTELQELFFLQLSARLAHLVLLSGAEATDWNKYTNTLQVHERLQYFWTGDEEAELLRRDPSYALIPTRISALQAIADPGGLEEPFRMAKRDPELIAAAWEFDRRVRELDRELSI